MGMFDTIIGEIECPECRQTKEREIQTKRGPCLMETYHLGDTIEPFFFGDYWFEEEWYCGDCHKRAREKDENAKIDWHKVYVHCINGLIVGISNARGEEEKLPDWTLIHRISRDRHNYRNLLLKSTVRSRALEGEKRAKPTFLLISGRRLRMNSLRGYKRV